MDKERVNLGLGGPAKKPELPTGIPFSVPVSDCVLGKESKKIWRYRAPANMVIYPATIFCESITPTSPVMVEVYLNGKYVVELPLVPGGTTVTVPVQVSHRDLLELSLGTRGTEVEVTVKDIWIMYIARI